MITLTLIPRKNGSWYEPIEILDYNGYPITFAHIDTFYKKDDKRIYDKLNDGETVIVELVDISQEVSDQTP